MSEHDQPLDDPGPKASGTEVRGGWKVIHTLAELCGELRLCMENQNVPTDARVSFFDGACSWPIEIIIVRHRTGDQIWITAPEYADDVRARIARLDVDYSLRALESVEAALCCEWLRADGAGKHLAPVIERASAAILVAGGDSLWPRVQSK